jgi:pyrroloquinoline quinone biosynthesis protein D
MRERLLVTEHIAPHLPRGVRLRFDPVRERHVLLAPERLLLPDETAVAILQSCDGNTSVSDIARSLAARFDSEADAIVRDVIELLQDLADRGFVRA